ncbi:MAG: hypothetical protein U0234_15810 [Sandaracinus sp.]
MRRAALLLGLALGACQSAPSPGAPCTRESDCSAPTVCRYGRCRAECATNRDCGAAQSCILSEDRLGVCQLDVDLGCETGVGRTCPAGLVCANDRCINECGSSADCPADGECHFSTAIGLRVCVDPGRVDPVGPDAGTRPTSPCGVTTDVCVGHNFACALRDGHVFCWGDDSSGQHGDLVGLHDYLPTEVVGPDMMPLDDIVEIGCGALHVCARDAARNVVCWGGNSSGELGNEGTSTGNRSSYVRVDVTRPEFASVRSLDAARLVIGSAHSAIRRQVSGHWIVWGDNAQAELLPGSPGAIPSGVPASWLDEALVLAFGTSHACAATATSVICTGPTGLEELGDTSLASLAGARDLALGYHHSCALTPSGIVCWGSDVLGQLGDGPNVPPDPGCGTGTCSFAPRPVALADVARLVPSSGADTSCAITTTGELYCWGENGRGQVDASGSVRDAPVRQDGLAGFVCDAEIGLTTICALTASDQGGTVYCWGENGSGQIGLLPDGIAHPVPSPIVLP